MENRNDVRLITTVPMVSLPATPGQAVLSVKDSLHQIVKEMRGLKASYRNAVREFQERYIVALLIKHACHLGRLRRILECIAIHSHASSANSKLTPRRFEGSRAQGPSITLRSEVTPIWLGSIPVKASKGIANYMGRVLISEQLPAPEPQELRRGTLD
jgi:hypothetical protein